jgi:hypothetical protein
MENRIMKCSRQLIREIHAAVATASPASIALIPFAAVPGSPIQTAVAKTIVKPRIGLRSPSPAKTVLVPTEALPGSPF